MNVDDNNKKVVAMLITPVDPQHRLGSRDIHAEGRLLVEEDNLVREHFSVQFSN